MIGTGYLLDTNIFIASKNGLPRDVWPTFWERLSGLIMSGDIFTSEKVRDEIDRGNDELTVWMRDNTTERFYIKVNADVIEQYCVTMNWARHNHAFKDSAISAYADAADAYLVATAAAMHMTLVTNEVSSPNSRSRVKIPDACLAIGVRCCDLNTMLRELGVVI